MDLPLNIDVQQILLHLFNFVILAGGLYLLLYKPVKDFMDQRARKYEEMDEKARQNLKESEEARALYEQKLADSDQEIRKLREKAQQEADEAGLKTRLLAKKEAERILEDARAQAENEHEKAIDSARKDIEELAIQATEKLVKEKVSDSYDDFLNAAEKG